MAPRRRELGQIFAAIAPAAHELGYRALWRSRILRIAVRCHGLDLCCRFDRCVVPVEQRRWRHAVENWGRSSLRLLQRRMSSEIVRSGGRASCRRCNVNRSTTRSHFRLLVHQEGCMILAAAAPAAHELGDRALWRPRILQTRPIAVDQNLRSGC